MEVLVSIVVLSFGMLGMVGLQAAALQANREARLQSTAVNLARELAEMMRGNKDIGIRTTNNPYVGSFTASPLVPANASYCLSVPTGTAACADAKAIGDAQMTEWLARVSAELPGARVTVCLDTAPYATSGADAGLPQWTCTSSGADIMFIKIGWTRGSTDRTPGAAAVEKASDTGSRPGVIYPVTAGSAA